MSIKFRWYDWTHMDIWGWNYHPSMTGGFGLWISLGPLEIIIRKDA